jgi:hypothetical protein
MRYMRMLLVLGLLLGLAGMGSAMAATATTSVGMSATVTADLSLSNWICMGIGTGDIDTSITYTSMSFGALTYNTTYGYWSPNVNFCVFLAAHTTGRQYTITMAAMTPFLLGTHNITSKMVITPGYVGADAFSATAPAQDDTVANGGLGPLSLLTGPQLGTAALTDAANVKSRAITVGAKTFYAYTGRPSIGTQARQIFRSDTTGQTRIVRCYVGFYTADPATKTMWGQDPAGSVSYVPTTVGAGTYLADSALLVNDSDVAGASSSSGGSITFTVTA